MPAIPRRLATNVDQHARMVEIRRRLVDLNLLTKPFLLAAYDWCCDQAEATLDTLEKHQPQKGEPEEKKDEKDEVVF